MITSSVKKSFISQLWMAIMLTIPSFSFGYESIKFSTANIDEVLEKASQEGKLVFLDFYASWCTPCKWMEQTTFTDDRIVEKLNKDFIALKVNIDDVEGFKMKNHFDVNFLPTILILNSNGKMVERIEETVTANDLVSILELHNSAENKVIIKHDFNTSPKKIEIKEGLENDPWLISQDDYRRYKDEEEKRNYRVQIGVYEDYAIAQKQVESLRETFMEPIVVLNEFTDEKVLFKIMLGQFESMSEADSFCKILANHYGINAIVK